MLSQGQVGSAPLLRSRCQLSSLVRSGAGRAMMFQVEAQQEQRRGSDTWEWQVIWYCWVPGRGEGIRLEGRGGQTPDCEGSGGRQRASGLGRFWGRERHTAPGVRLIKTCRASRTVRSAIIKSIKMSLTTLTTVEF